MEQSETLRLAAFVEARATGRRFARLPASDGLAIAWAVGFVASFALLLFGGTLLTGALSARPSSVTGKEFYGIAAQTLPVFYFALVVSPALRSQPGSEGANAALIVLLTVGTVLGEAASLYVLASGDTHAVNAFRLVVAAFGVIVLCVAFELILVMTQRLRRGVRPTWPR